MRLFSNSDAFKNATANRRTWPDEDNEVRRLENSHSAILGLSSSDRLRNALPYFDFGYFRKDISDYLNAKKDEGNF